MKANQLPPLEFLNMTFEVNPKSPSGLSWKNPNPMAKCLKPGDAAGSLCKDGYWQVKLTYQGKTKLYQVHRIIYAIAKSMNIDDYIIDHIKGKTNNIANLRCASHSLNACNSKCKATEQRTSKYKGVHFMSSKKGNKKWRACIQINKTRKHLGYFDNEIDAAHAYDLEAKKLHKEFALLNFPEQQ